MPDASSIAIFTSEIEAFGGAERSLLALSHWLYEQGRPNHILVYWDHIGLERYATHPVEVVQLKPAGGVRVKIAAMKAALPSTAPRPILSGYQPALHATLAGIRGFHTLMHDTPSLFGDAHRRSFKHRLRIAVSNRIIGYGLRSGGVTTVNSEYLRDECRRDFGIEARIVRMGGLAVNYDATPHPLTERLNMLSVCRIEENKRIDWLLHALGILEKSDAPLSRTIDWHLDLVGKGTLIPQLTLLAENLGIGNRVTFHGFVSDDDLESFYKRAHLFLMPAVQGYGIPALEALQRGIPVLLHRDSGVSDILLRTSWAFVMDGGEEAMVPALKEALESVMTGKHCNAQLPDIPTEEGWAREVAKLFGYGPQ